MTLIQMVTALNDMALTVMSPRLTHELFSTYNAPCKEGTPYQYTDLVKWLSN